MSGIRVKRKINFLGIALLYLAISCHNREVSTKTILNNPKNDISLQLNETIPLIDSLSVHWNSAKNDIETDSLFHKIQIGSEGFKKVLLNLITDSSLSISTICKKNKLHKGDFAFMVLDKIYHIPFFQLFKIQFDAYDSHCAYPSGLFDYIDSNRQQVRNNLYRHFFTVE